MLHPLDWNNLQFLFEWVSYCDLFLTRPEATEDGPIYLIRTTDQFNFAICWNIWTCGEI
jgi:hypothetical protein